MEFAFQDVIDLNNNGKTIQVANGPNGELIQYFLDGEDLIKNRFSFINRANYDKVEFEHELPMLMKGIKERFSIKNIIGLGAYGVYQNKGSDNTFVRVPLSKHTKDDLLNSIDPGEGLTGITMEELNIVMASDITPSPFVAAASTSYGSTWAAWRAFDGFAAGGDCWASGPGGMPQWISIDAGEPAILREYNLSNRRSGGGYAPVDFTVEGSDDNANWTVVDTVVNRTIVQSPGYTTTHELETPVKFRYYRMYITKHHALETYVAIGQWKLF